MRSLECRFGNVQSRPEGVQGHLRVQVECGIIGTKSQIPTMQLAKLGMHLQNPIVAFRVGMHRHGKISAHAEIIAAREAQNVRKRSITPRQVEYRRAQTRGSAAHTARNINRASLLEDHSGARRHGLEVHRPAPLAIRLQVAIDVDQSERKLFADTLKIDPAGVHLNAAKANRSKRQRLASGAIPRRSNLRSRCELDSRWDSPARSYLVASVREKDSASEASP